MIGCAGLLFDHMFEKLKDARYFNAERFTPENFTMLILVFIAAGVVIVLLGVRHSRIKPENNPT
jgi:hypothetical protein